MSREAFEAALDRLLDSTSYYGGREVVLRSHEDAAKALRALYAAAIERAEKAEAEVAILNKINETAEEMETAISDTKTSFRAEVAALKADLEQIRRDVQPLQDIAPALAWGQNVCAWAAEHIAALKAENDKRERTCSNCGEYSVWGLGPLADEITQLKAELAAVREALTWMKDKAWTLAPKEIVDRCNQALARTMSASQEGK